MALHIVNRAKHLLIIPLNSGKTVHLAPGESSHPVQEREINANEKVAKLLKENLIATTRVPTAKKPRLGFEKEPEEEPVKPPEAEPEKKPKRRAKQKK